MTTGCGRWERSEEEQANLVTQEKVLLEAFSVELAQAPAKYIGLWRGDILGHKSSVEIGASGDIRLTVGETITSEKIVKDEKGVLFMTDLSNKKLLKIEVFYLSNLEVLKVYGLDEVYKLTKE